MCDSLGETRTATFLEALLAPMVEQAYLDRKALVLNLPKLSCQTEERKEGEEENKRKNKRESRRRRKAQRRKTVADRQIMFCRPGAGNDDDPADYLLLEFMIEKSRWRSGRE